MKHAPRILFDRHGRSYTLPGDLDLEPFRNNACTYAGFAGDPKGAPSPPEQPCPGPGGAEIASPRHFDSASDFYHTDWQWGELEFAGQHGLHGLYLCYHAHRSPESAVADFDPSCEMVKIEDEEEVEEDAFAIVLE